MRELQITAVYTVAGVRVGREWVGLGMRMKLNFSRRKAREAPYSEQRFVFGEMIFDGYFWELSKWKFMSPPILSVSIWQRQISSPHSVFQMALKRAPLAGLY